MPAFSNKKKKEQLRLKRLLKRERNDDPSSFYKSISQKSHFKGKQQNGNNDNRNGGPDKRKERFADLQFFKDDDEEIKLRKEQSMLPITMLEESHLEVDAQCPAASLDMPKRPPWNKSMSVRQLDEQEQRHFKQFTNNLLSQSDDSDKKLSYFDLNLETWRQLWRVIEMSEIVTIVVDIRHPLFHFPPTLYDYIVNDLKKMVIIVLNKIDLVPASLVAAWMDYLNKQYPEVHIIPFASYAGMKSKKDGRRVGKLHMATDGARRFLLEVEKMVGQFVDLTSWKEKIQEELKANGKPINLYHDQVGGDGDHPSEHSGDNVSDQDDDSASVSSVHSDHACVEEDEHDQDCPDEDAISEVDSDQEAEDSEQDVVVDRSTLKNAAYKKNHNFYRDHRGQNKHDYDNHKDSREEVEESDDSDDANAGRRALRQARQISQKNDATYYNEEKFKNGLLTIGCVGHPNVGKSSFMNALIGKKVVSVSRTPGHTKHFQTIFLTPNVRLCDCPGLVFPSYYPKQLQVIMGCYPISQLREPYSSIQYIAERLNLPEILKLKPIDEIRHHLEGRQNLTKAQQQQIKDDIEWSAYSICESWAMIRGFLTARSGRPDVYRAANHLLRMALDGRTICLTFYPPDYFKLRDNHWELHEDTARIQSIQGRQNIINEEEEDY